MWTHLQQCQAVSSLTCMPGVFPLSFSGSGGPTRERCLHTAHARSLLPMLPAFAGCLGPRNSSGSSGLQPAHSRTRYGSRSTQTVQAQNSMQAGQHTVRISSVTRYSSLRLPNDSFEMRFHLPVCSICAVWAVQECVIVKGTLCVGSECGLGCGLHAKRGTVAAGPLRPLQLCSLS